MKRAYYSERIGKVPSHITVDRLKEILDIQYRKFMDEGYFQKAFGYYCVDSGDVPGEVKIGMSEQLILDFGNYGEKMLPTKENILKLSEDSLFDLIEFLYDYVAKPIKFAYHSWNNCGIHVNTASENEGRKEWQNEINKWLALLEQPFQLSNEGNIESIPSSSGLKHLIDDHKLHDEPENIDNRVERSCRLFLGHNATLDDKRDALKNLADVLELLRNEIKDKIPKKEANDIFNIANNFGIRHHNDKQQTRYNQGVYYRWIFYSYLSTIDLLARLKTDQSETIK